jgi:antitoxin FitA
MRTRVRRPHTCYDSIDINAGGEQSVSDLLVRGLDESIVQALKERAAKHKRSAEAEHRAILIAALARPRRRSFAEALARIPNAGTDADFERRQNTAEAPRVFD